MARRADLPVEPPVPDQRFGTSSVPHVVVVDLAVARFRASMDAW